MKIKTGMKHIYYFSVIGLLCFIASPFGKQNDFWYGNNKKRKENKKAWRKK